MRYAPAILANLGYVAMGFIGGVFWFHWIVYNRFVKN